MAAHILSVLVVLCGGVCFADDTPIFNGKTLDGWTTEDDRPVTGGWRVVDGVIHLDLAAGQNGGNIITIRDYQDFELNFDFRIAEKGNSGIKYRVRDFDGRLLGCEYQILDDAHHRQSRPDQMTGSLYGVYEANPSRCLKPAGEFNHGRIVVCGHRVEHWLNGQLIVYAQVCSRQWFRRVTDSKFSDVAGFGQNRSGRIMLTDHGSEVWYRNITLREFRDRRPVFANAARPARRRAVTRRSAVFYRPVAACRILRRIAKQMQRWR